MEISFVDLLIDALTKGDRDSIYQIIMKIPPAEEMEEYQIDYIKNSGQRNLGIGYWHDDPNIFVKTYQEKLYATPRGPRDYLDIACQTVNYVLMHRLAEVAPHFLQVYHRFRNTEKVFIFLDRADMDVAKYLRNLMFQLIPEELLPIWDYYHTSETRAIDQQYQALRLLESRIEHFSNDAKEAAVKGDKPKVKNILKIIKQHADAYQLAEKKLFDLQDIRELAQGPIPNIPTEQLEKFLEDVTNTMESICTSIRLQILIIDYLIYRYYHTAHVDQKMNNYVIDLATIVNGNADREIYYKDYALVSGGFTHISYQLGDQIIHIPIRHRLNAETEQVVIVKVADVEILKGGNFAFTPELKKVIAPENANDPTMRFLSDCPRKLSYKSIIKHAMLPNDIYFHDKNGPLLRIPIDDEPIAVDPVVPSLRFPLPNNRFETMIAHLAPKCEPVTGKCLQLNIP